MNFDTYFDSFDNPNIKENITKYNCCEDIHNYLCDNGMIICKSCNNQITNIVDNPEWRYYGAGDSKNKDPTRCGMPENVLLPKSSLGSTISYGKNDETLNKISIGLAIYMEEYVPKITPKIIAKEKPLSISPPKI